MSAHLYNAGFGKVAWFIRRFGWRELFMKPIRTVVGPLVAPRLPHRSFEFQGRVLQNFYHPYNMAWAGERCAEVPLARHYLSQRAGGRTLEVGNVLSHYGPVEHRVLDKYEQGPGVVNEDIVDFRPEKPLDLILSISTFEHIGFDDDTEDPGGGKILRAIEACRRMLSSGGLLVISVPLGYNPHLDAMMADNEVGAARAFYLERRTYLTWQCCDRAQALTHHYCRPFPYANALAVLEFDPTPVTTNIGESRR